MLAVWMSVKFLNMQNVMQWWTRIHPAVVSMFISLFKTSVNVASLYGADSLLALDLHLFSVYLRKWFEYVHAHINEAPTDVWDRYEYVPGVGPGSCCAPEIQALPCFCTWKHPRLTLRGGVGPLKHANVVLPSPAKVDDVFANTFTLEN